MVSAGMKSDTLNPDLRSKRMSRVRGKNIASELNVRRLIHAIGYRSRLHAATSPAPRPGDCFWHRHPYPAGLARLPSG